MRYSDVPRSIRALEQRIRNREGDEGLALRCRREMALAIIGQMLPEGTVKGGSAMALRYGRDARFTRDLDVARVRSLAEFRSDFEQTLAAGWSGFTGRLVERPSPRPLGVPAGYVMRPFDIKLAYRGRSWCTVTFELGHNEIGDAEATEYLLSFEIAELFVEVGLPRPAPVPVMRVDHQIAQKLHAASSPPKRARARHCRSAAARTQRESRPEPRSGDLRPLVRLPAPTGLAAECCGRRELEHALRLRRRGRRCHQGRR